MSAFQLTMMAAGCDDVGTLLSLSHDSDATILHVLNSEQPDSASVLSIGKLGD